MFPKALRYFAFALTVVYTLTSGTLLAGAMATHPGGWQSTLAIAGWALPLAGLAALALLRPAGTGPALGWTAAAVVEVVLLVGSVGLFPYHLASRVSAVMVLVVAVPLGFLGLHRPRFAGVFLLGLGCGYLTAVIIGSLIGGAAPAHWFDVRGWARPIGLPVPILALVYLAASLLQRPVRASPPVSVPRPGSSGVGNARRGRPARLQARNRHPER